MHPPRVRLLQGSSGRPSQTQSLGGWQLRFKRRAWTRVKKLCGGGALGWTSNFESRQPYVWVTQEASCSNGMGVRAASTAAVTCGKSCKIYS